MNAKKQIEGGGGVTSTGSIKGGRLLFVSGVYAKELYDLTTKYYWSYRIIAPAELGIFKILTGEIRNPLVKITYAVLRVNMKEIKWEDFLKTK